MPHTGNKWLCTPCANGVAPRAARCVLCAGAGGAMQPTGREDAYAHVLCGWWDPAAAIPDCSRMRPILVDSRLVSRRRRAKVCSHCGVLGGLGLECHSIDCENALHLPCALVGGGEARIAYENGILVRHVRCGDCLARIGADPFGAGEAVPPLAGKGGSTPPAESSAAPPVAEAQGSPRSPVARAFPTHAELLRVYAADFAALRPRLSGGPRAALEALLRELRALWDRSRHHCEYPVAPFQSPEAFFEALKAALATAVDGLRGAAWTARGVGVLHEEMDRCCARMRRDTVMCLSAYAGEGDGPAPTPATGEDAGECGGLA